AAITARPRSAAPLPSRFPSPFVGGQGGGRLPPNCNEEATPFGPVAVRREWFPDDGSQEVGALSTCLGFAPDELRHPLFLDTETTRLSGGTGTAAFLVGLACGGGEVRPRPPSACLRWRGGSFGHACPTVRCKPSSKACSTCIVPTTSPAA